MSSFEPNRISPNPFAATREAFVALHSLAGHGPLGTRGIETAPPVEAEAVVRFWSDAGPRLWFAKDSAFDERFRARFLALYADAEQGALDEWIATRVGALALVLLLDQFPRNAFRGSARMYATDAKAREVADAAIHGGFDRATADELRLFFYLPFAHSEDMADQSRAVELTRALAEPNPSHARRHRNIIWRFGRFPHRNMLLGRTMRPEEQRFLDEGGYAG